MKPKGREKPVNKWESKYFNTARRMDEALLSLLLEKEFAYITVKEVCVRAGVNRSTFYLHYENTADLLKEAVEMVETRFRGDTPAPQEVSIGEDIPLEELFFMTDEYLLPYLEFVRENKHIYKAVHAQMEVFGGERVYEQMFQRVFSPVLSRYGVEKEKHEYIMEFYRYGLAAVLMKWVDAGCQESPEQIAGIIQMCVREYRP